MEGHRVRYRNCNTNKRTYYFLRLELTTSNTIPNAITTRPTKKATIPMREINKLFETLQLLLLIQLVEALP